MSVDNPSATGNPLFPPADFNILDLAETEGSDRSGPKVHIVSLGCPKNRVDSELMVGLIRDQGASLTNDPEEADTIVINTCSFLQSATEESIDTILSMGQLKRDGDLSTLIVTGCLVQRYGGGELADSLPEVDVFLGTNEFTRINDAIAGTLPERTYLSTGSHLYQAGDPRFPVTHGASSYLKVSEGCNRTCSFCIIPDIRGKQVSRPIDDLIREAHMLAQSGIQELVLIAQDLTSYGVDFKKRDALETLLLGLNQVDGLRWIRLMYCYPWNFTDRLVGIIRDCERVLPYVDMPLQHISDRVLKSMRRNVRRDAQIELLRKLRQVDGMVLRTTFIAGYPGETEAEFDELCQWVEEVDFDRVGVFPYSIEPGTRAADMDQQVPDEVKFARRDKLMKIQQGIALQRNRRLLGQTLSVLVDGASSEHEYVLEGRYYGQAPDIDGSVYLNFEDESPMTRPGAFVDVRIDDVSPYDLVGTVVAPTLS